MREIKFRALAKDGTWRYGEYPHSAPEMRNTHYPMDIFWNSFLISFRRETLGLWTGLLDKQGKRIFEGDVLKMASGGLRIVKWSHKGKGFELYTLDKPTTYFNSDWTDFEISEVIGNIYEHPELLKESENARP